MFILSLFQSYSALVAYFHFVLCWDINAPYFLLIYFLGERVVFSEAFELPPVGFAESALTLKFKFCFCFVRLIYEQIFLISLLQGCIFQ